MPERDMTALELSPFMHIAHNLVNVAQRINSCREASTRSAHGMQDGPPALAHGTPNESPSASASQQGQGLQHMTHGALDEVQPRRHTSLGWPRDGERILWDSDRLACVWRHVQLCHIQQGQRLDLEGLAGELGLWHPLHRYNKTIQTKYYNLASKFNNTGMTPSLETGPRSAYISVCCS